MSGADVWAKRLEGLEDKSFKTYKARLEACKRLEMRSRALNGLVVALSLAALIAASGMVRDKDLYGPNGDVLWLFIAIFTFAGSLASSSVGYGARSRNMFQSYRRIQRLSVRAETAKYDDAQHTEGIFTQINSEYDDLLDESENHTSADYLRARRQFSPSVEPSKRERLQMIASATLTWVPWLATLIPLVLVIPAFQTFGP